MEKINDLLILLKFDIERISEFTAPEYSLATKQHSVSNAIQTLMEIYSQFNKQFKKEEL